MDDSFILSITRDDVSVVVDGVTLANSGITVVDTPDGLRFTFPAGNIDAAEAVVNAIQTAIAARRGLTSGAVVEGVI